jgi:hypothetical protein
MTKRPKIKLEVVNSNGLTDADWAEINRLQKVLDEGGIRAMSKAINELTEANPVLCVRVMGAFFPDEIREQIKDTMAAAGLTAEDLREMIQKHENPKH